MGMAGLLYLGGGHPSLGKDITIDTALDPEDLQPGETASKLAAKMGLVVSGDEAADGFLSSFPVPSQSKVPEGSIILPLRVVPPTVSTPYEHIQIAFKPPKADDPILYTIDPPAGQHGDVVLEAMSTYALAVAGWENYTNIGEAFVWTPQDGITLIGPGKAFGINADGTVVVGTDPDIKGFRWTEATGMVPIGGIFSGGHSEAFAVSNDGSAIAGDAQVADQSSTYHAIRWDLLVLRGDGSVAAAAEFKRAVVHQLVAQGFAIEFAFDDDERTVEMYLAEGIPAMYVHSGYYAGQHPR